MKRIAVVLGALALIGCEAENGTGRPPDATAVARSDTMPVCDPDNGGITLPDGFCAIVVAEGLVEGQAMLRHIGVDADGDIYVGVQGKEGAESPSERGAVIALRDTTGDGRADQTALFGPEGGTGIEIRDGTLYFATNSAVLRYALGDGLEPASGPDTIVHSLPADHSHTAKSIALGSGDQLFVNMGAPTNACQPVGADREPGVPGLDPCTQLDTRGGVWLFSMSGDRQTQADGERWATGIRNAVALDVNSGDGNLYVVQHGRDQLDIWPGFDSEDNSEGPAEELQLVGQGTDFGWPYCYYDTRLNHRVLAPEYGGDGQEVGRCADKDDPLMTFPGHWAPNDLLFYTGSQFPERYRGGAFIAFHGSWNRAPRQAGYRVAFVPFSGGAPAGEWETFADGFAGVDQPKSAGDAEHRPMGLAVGPDGSLYITDSVEGRIWRVFYTGG